ncbi:MAG TPA: DUF58 domain-containing protein [Thermodesulfobacteriota bacterium]|nr:DUF58 domain-containing protein [Thermodesulfobacteriota bacterium]
MTYFDPKVLSQLKNLFLRARRVVDGVMVGVHPSRSKGFTSEFEGHREYSQSDDIRHIDWKAYGKFDRYFIKEYRETTNLRAFILLDASSSMGYGSNGWTKFDYASTLTASLAYLMLKQQDSVGLITFSNRIEKRVPPKATSGHLFAILKELEDKKPEGGTSAGSILEELAGSLKRKGLLLLVSDLLDKPEDVIRGLKQLRSKGNDILVFHVLDRDELEFPFKDPTLFLDMEEEIKLLTDPYTIKPAYLKAIHALIENYREACAQNLMDYSLLDTSIGLDRALVRYLKWREKFR